MSRSDTLRANIQHAVEQGYHAGNYPFGYHRVDWRNPVPEPNPNTAPFIIGAFRARAKGYSLRHICKALSDFGVTSNQGNEIGPQTLRGILANPFYMGEILFKGKRHPGKHIPLVTPKEFQAAQISMPDSKIAGQHAQRGGRGTVPLCKE